MCACVHVLVAHLFVRMFFSYRDVRDFQSGSLPVFGFGERGIYVFRTAKLLVRLRRWRGGEGGVGRMVVCGR